MDSLLRKLKLLDHLTIEMEIGRNEFVERLKKIVDRGDTGFFLSPFEAFSSSGNEYKGVVTHDTFKIRRRRRFFDMMHSHVAVAEGRFHQKDDRLVIESTIKVFGWILIPFLIFMLAVYITLFLGIGSSENTGSFDWFIVLFLFLHASLMFGIPYFIMRRAVSRMKYELERDLFFLTKGKIHTSL